MCCARTTLYFPETQLLDLRMTSRFPYSEKTNERNDSITMSTLCPPSPLVGLHLLSLLGPGSRHCYGIISLIDLSKSYPELSNLTVVKL